MKLVAGLLYNEEHEWLKVEGDVAYFGITDFAQTSLGGIVYVELPEEEDEIEKGENFSVIESVKAATDLESPVDGEIIEVNENLEDAPELLNENPYDNWIVKLKLTDLSQLNDFMSSDDYQTFCSKES